jgi:type I restriction-modification system DNA methylase subunit
MAKNSPKADKLLLFKKTQKLLDRFLFILFAEDKGLLPPNSTSKVVKQWEQLKELDAPQPLYERFKLYFHFLNVGRTGKGADIFAYNGGLFETDDVLDGMKIDDSVLHPYIAKLTTYDFESEVDVNILGHIFEHSLAELENITAELEGKVVDKSKTKRKKDGIFYTPKYITKYMVDNTLGRLCEEKKLELEISDDVYEETKKRSRKRSQNLEAYRKWLLDLKVCDPACGSGAFLNQSLDFLIKEHHYLDELSAKYHGESLVLPDVEKQILEHNIYGVDINEESIEIARLSLWLRTAAKGRKLTTLSNHIKCGNSLIDDPAVAGVNAFNWQKEFPEVFTKGGFDVVIGNPPYVDIKGLDKSTVDYLFNQYKSANNRINLYSSFVEKSLVLLRSKGYFSFIIPSSILTQDSYKELRAMLLNKTAIKNIVRLPNESFGGSAGEVKVDTIILTFQYSKLAANQAEITIYKGFDRINEISQFNADIHFQVETNRWLKDENFIFRINTNDSISDLIGKSKVDTLPLIECADFCLGLTPYDKYKGHTAEQIESRIFHATEKKNETFKKLLAGNDVARYYVKWNGSEWISYGNWLGAPRESKFFTKKRILIKQIIDWTDKRIWAALTEEELYNTQNAFNLIAKSDYEAEYLIAIINSRFISFYHKKVFLEEYKDRFQKILIKDCKQFPIKKIGKIQQEPFIEKVSSIMKQTILLNALLSHFITLLQGAFSVDKLSNKLQDWHKLEFKDFLSELKKQKIVLKLAQQSEWMTFFNEQKQKAQTIQAEITHNDEEIDRMVYELYGLTEEEIKIVKES